MNSLLLHSYVSSSSTQQKFFLVTSRARPLPRHITASNQPRGACIDHLWCGEGATRAVSSFHEKCEYELILPGYIQCYARQVTGRIEHRDRQWTPQTLYDPALALEKTTASSQIKDEAYTSSRV